MLAPEISPMHALVSQWRSRRLPSIDEINPLRIQLMEAAKEEIRISHQQRKYSPDPMHDPRFVWANQWLDVGAGARRSIDSDVQFMFNVRINPTPFLRQDFRDKDDETPSSP
jgi:hypothetical protein